jgi:WD40 repeat protein
MAGFPIDPLGKDGHERQEVISLPEPSGEVWSLAVSPDGQKIASAGYDNPAKVWDVETHQVTAKLPGLREVVFCVAWHPDGRIASAHGGGDQLRSSFGTHHDTERENSRSCRVDAAAAFAPTAVTVTGRGTEKYRLGCADGRPIGGSARIGRSVVFNPDGGIWLRSVTARSIVGHNTAR